MTHKATQQEELERIDTMTILEAVAYANRLSKRLSSYIFHSHVGLFKQTCVRGVSVHDPG